MNRHFIVLSLCSLAFAFAVGCAHDGRDDLSDEESAALSRLCFLDPAANFRIAAVRDQIEAQCPCASAESFSKYKRCATDVAKKAVTDGALGRNCLSTVRAAVAKSTCGTPDKVACCMSSNRCAVQTAEACSRHEGSVGASASCFDACPVCGNSVVEVGEGCDDGNTVAGDGCSASCTMELQAGCVAVSEADYASSVASDPSFKTLRERLPSLGYSPNLLSPVRCNEAVGVRYSAVLAGAKGIAFIQSRSGTPTAQTLVFAAPSATMLDVHTETGTFRFDGSNANDPLITLLDSPSPTALARASTASTATVSTAALATANEQSAPSFECAEHARTRNGCQLNYLKNNKLTTAACSLGVAALLFPSHWFGQLSNGLGSATCLQAIFNACPLTRTCATDNCSAGTCDFSGLASDSTCEPNASGASLCNGCQQCVQNDQGVFACKTVMADNVPVMMKVSNGQSREFCSLGCAECGWCLDPGWPNGCIAFSQVATQYFSCSGQALYSCAGQATTGTESDWRICGGKCGAGQECDLEPLKQASWDQINACSVAHGGPSVPGPLEVGTTVSF